MSSSRFFIHQIYYDSVTRNTLDPDFLPLDNGDNPRLDWREFWVMRQFLLDHPVLDETAWYGFLSPKFRSKTGLSAQDVMRFIEQLPGDSNVALFSPSWDQNAYFRNPFEQGEFWHPGIMARSQAALHRMGYPVDLQRLVCHSGSTTFSNYIVAKPVFWREWLNMAKRLFALVEDQADSELSRALCDATIHTHEFRLEFKVFVQERLPAILLQGSRFRVGAFDFGATAPILTKLFSSDPGVRLPLMMCDMCKKQYAESGDVASLERYYLLRRTIPLLL